ncbi:hypothetical protein EMIHUDRAFT_460709, partial [Emiliania huxleyi CCMP1516]|uniref:Uncharacterized protein n=2 Tax=Emiliania huxleyi TaxID=2903 RepID=A0A0D3JZD2_EMIH1
ERAAARAVPRRLCQPRRPPVAATQGGAERARLAPARAGGAPADRRGVHARPRRRVAGREGCRHGRRAVALSQPAADRPHAASAAAAAPLRLARAAAAPLGVEHALPFCRRRRRAAAEKDANLPAVRARAARHL